MPRLTPSIFGIYSVCSPNKTRISRGLKCRRFNPTLLRRRTAKPHVPQRVTLLGAKGRCSQLISLASVPSAPVRLCALRLAPAALSVAGDGASEGGAAGQRGSGADVGETERT